MSPMYVVLRKMNVLRGSKPKAMMSFTFSPASSCAATPSMGMSRKKNFSSSVICITTGSPRASCRWRVSRNGTTWPTCIDRALGPRPVYKYALCLPGANPARTLPRALPKSRCEKTMPRRKK
ncbi:hypothetical protein DQ04_24221000 [Trypanosoma grayi]|uniref:hypothetical protein n=1 Tax=Trypanosoma grayi TaxID=71804 RepID=UPI0004F43699|nr:hypothetical protein DQ04_24221000 [Trypanosoma grayi]KEG05275.1 hypothetical protein DQ04_24221000 [Trypanosoma grayi]